MKIMITLLAMTLVVLNASAYAENSFCISSNDKNVSIVMFDSQSQPQEIALPVELSAPNNLSFVLKEYSGELDLSTIHTLKRILVSRPKVESGSFVFPGIKISIDGDVTESVGRKVQAVILEDTGFGKGIREIRLNAKKGACKN